MVKEEPLFLLSPITHLTKWEPSNGWCGKTNHPRVCVRVRKMPLPEPRHGEPGRIPLYPNTSDELTLGDPEKVICSSIKQFCVLDVAEGVLFETHGIRNRRSQKAAAMNVKLYIQQALEYYEVAKYAKPNTAPLFYYYCFLHLGKARCEMFLPIFHRKDESYRHGISWRPNRKYIVDMENDFVSLTNRGIWHVLWEAVTCRSSQALNSLPLRIKELFSICPKRRGSSLHSWHN